MKLFGRRPAPAVIAPDSSEPEPEVIYAEVLLEEGREELQKADTKASILFAASGVAFTVVIGPLFRGEWSPNKLTGNGWAPTLFWAGGVLGLIGLALITWSVVPRTRHIGDRTQLAYFGHVVRYREKGLAIRQSTRRYRTEKSKRELKQAIVAASASSFDRTVDQVWSISRIAHKRYVLIRGAILAYSVMVALWIVSLSLNVWV